MTFVLSLPSFNFFTAKGRVKIIKSRVSKTKISNCHLKGSPVFAIKINGMLATIENNHYESGENHQKKSKRKSHYYNNSKGSTIVLANNAQKIGANE